jgi:hypothetical protein
VTVDVGLRSEAMASLSVRSPVGTSLELHLKLAWTLFFYSPRRARSRNDGVLRSDVVARADGAFGRCSTLSVDPSHVIMIQEGESRVDASIWDCNEGSQEVRDVGALILLL